MKNGTLLTFALLFVFTTFLSAQITKTWDGGAIPVSNEWGDGDNWNPNGVPGDTDHVLIISGADVTLGEDAEILSLTIGNGGAGTGIGKLTIELNNTLTTTGSAPSNNEGVHLSTAASNADGNHLEVIGHLVISGCNDNGIESLEESSLIVGSNGSISITSVGDNGMEIYSEFINSGDITITTPPGQGIVIKGAANSSTLINNASGNIIVDMPSEDALKFANNTTFTNDGTLTLTSAFYIFLGPGVLINNGTLEGTGTIDGREFTSNNSSRLSPGTSIGKLTFDWTTATQDLSDIFFDIEIEGSTTPGTDYDQVAVGKSVKITDAVLNLIEGSYTPVSGDVFKIIDVGTGGSVTGTFNGILEGGTIPFMGETLFISYAGGDGNDVTASFDAPLPVELIEFNARPADGEVKVNWTTANEVNNDYFTLERSIDGRNFDAIAMVFGNGNTTEISKYTHMDENPTRGLSYYRLKQTDYDGTFSYSDIETVELAEEVEVQVYPTAVHDVLNIVVGGDVKNDITVVIRDLMGREYQSMVISSNKSKNEISLSDLVPGSYFVAIYDNEKVTTYKIIKL